MARTSAQQTAANAALGYPVLQCEQCATHIRVSLQTAGHHGEIIEIRGAGGGDFIVSGSCNNWQTTISQNGRHVGVNVDGVIFDNIHPNGLPLAEWLQDFDASGGIVIHSRIPF